MSSRPNTTSTADEDEVKAGESDPDAEETVGTVSSYQPPISAIPPRVTLTEESAMEVSASPAFQCLDDVSHVSRYDVQWCNKE